MVLQTLKRELWYQFQGLGHAVGFRGGGSAIPHVKKRRLIARFRRLYGCDVFIETGTYLGDMVAAQARQFRSIHSIEVSEELYARARLRFAGHSHIRLYCGNSGTVLRHVLASCSKRTLLWLDAHYSGGITGGDPDCVPILDELATVLDHPIRDHVVLIDDARLFDGSDGYPQLGQVIEFVRKRRSDLSIEVDDDVIRILPPLVVREPPCE